MKCVANVLVEKHNCLKKSSGVLVTSFDTNKKYQSETFISKLSTDYWKFKGYFQFPQQFEGLCCNNVKYI